MTSINFTRDDLAAAIKDARTKVEPGSAWARSIDRAEKNLAAGRFLFDGRFMKLASATSNRAYTLDTREPIACSCKDQTGKCWHISAARLIVRAAEQAAARTTIANLGPVSEHLTADEYIDMLAMRGEARACDDEDYESLLALVDELC